VSAWHAALLGSLLADALTRYAFEWSNVIGRDIKRTLSKTATAAGGNDLGLMLPIFACRSDERHRHALDLRMAG
jgi:hypothetical protein